MKKIIINMPFSKMSIENRRYLLKNFSDTEIKKFDMYFTTIKNKKITINNVIFIKGKNFGKNIDNDIILEKDYSHIKFYAYTPLSKKIRFNNAVQLIEKFLIQYTSDYKFILKESTTNNFKSFKDEVKNLGYMLVSEEGNNNTIYTKPYFNTIARLWHDTMHLNSDLDFSLEDEKIVAYLQIQYISDYGDKIGSCTQTIEDAKELIYHDIISQANYYQINKKFVDDQKKFVYSKFLNSGGIK